MARSFKRTDAAAYRGIDISAGGGNHHIGKGGVVAAAVVRMKHEYGIQQICFLGREFLVLSQKA